jgi:peptidoglycan LD-endopeptidase CwlK
MNSAITSLKAKGIDIEVWTKVLAVLKRMEDLGHPMMVTDGFRTTEQQQKLFAQGRSSPGKIVTHADGIKVKSNHQSGRAVDCCFLIEGKPSWDERLPWSLYGRIAKEHGLQWGGDWKRPDKPHIEGT